VLFLVPASTTKSYANDKSLQDAKLELAEA
jgi:hypothetical protein